MKTLTKENCKEIMELNNYVAKSAVFSTVNFSNCVNLTGCVNLMELTENSYALAINLITGTCFLPLCGTTEFDIDEVHNRIILNVKETVNANRLTMVYTLDRK